jgi:AcrR family transcriptional regulator
MSDGTRHLKSRISATFKSDVVTAARELFLANGVENTSMDDIARALKVSKPTVYEHFQSKQLLLDAVFLDATKDVEITWISDAEASKMPFDEFLREAKRYCIDFIRAPKRVEAYLLVVREGPRSSTMREAFLRFLGRPAALNMRNVIKAAIERGECRGSDADVVQRILSAPMYFAMTERAIFGRDAMSVEELTRYFEESFRVLADSLCVRPSVIDVGHTQRMSPGKCVVADL